MERQNPPSKEEWVNWRQSTCTQWLVSRLALKRAGMLEEWSEGRCGDRKAEDVTQGRVQQLRDIIEYVLRDFEYYNPEEDDEKRD